MPVVNGERNSWQTGAINDRPHAIEMIRKHSGGTVRAAFCDTRDTADILIEALVLLKRLYDANLANEERTEGEHLTPIAALLQRAGIIE